MPLSMETLRASATEIMEASVEIHCGQPGSLTPDEQNIQPALTEHRIQIIFFNEVPEIWCGGGLLHMLHSIIQPT